MTVSKLLLILAFVFFLLAALISDGVITASGMSWLVPAGLAAWVLAGLLE